LSDGQQLYKQGGEKVIAKRQLAFALCFAGVCVALSACGGSSSSSSDSTSSSGGGTSLDGKTIAFIQTFSNPYYDMQASGIEAAAKKLGGEAEVSVSNFEPGKERASVQNAITQQVSGVVLEPVSAASTAASLELLDQANIPTVVLYGYSPEVADKAAGFVQTLYTGTGGAAGTALKEALPSGEVAVITGALGRGDAEGMLEGFREEFGDNSRIVEVQDGKWDRATAFKDAQNIITAHPSLKGMFVMNEPMASGAIAALGPKIEGITLVSQNGSPEGLKLIEEGKIEATSAWSPSIEGIMATKYLTEVIDGKTPTDKLCLVPYVTVTKENIKESPPWNASESTVKEGLSTPCAEGSHP
jgi:ribose transport system substrate-binding protein